MNTKLEHYKLMLIGTLKINSKMILIQLYTYKQTLDLGE